MPVPRERISIPGGHSFRLLRWTDTLRDVECLVSPCRSEPVVGEGQHWHFHVEMELTFFTSGTGTCFLGDHIGAFSAPDLVLLGEKLPHYWKMRGASSGISVQWHFPDHHPFWAFPENLVLVELFKRSSRALRFTGATAFEVGRRLRELTQTTGPEQLALLLTALARLGAAPEAERRALSERSFSLSPETHYHQAIGKALRHLAARFRDQVRLGDLLKLTGLSRPTFARQFKRNSGRTFSEYLNLLRLDAACRELAESPRNVLDISLACGFTQVSFFNRLFRRVKKCSPTEYRAKLRNRPPSFSIPTARRKT
jgi:AraC-like DNA-binding protein